MSRLRSLFRGTEPPETPPAAEVASPAEPAGPVPVGVRIFTIDGTRELETEGELPRTSDLLNGTDHQLRIRESGAKDWEFVDVDELLVVVPPEQTSDYALRLHRPRQHVRVKLGPYIVDGAAHIPAGSQATSFLVPQRHHFVALTEAVIQHDESPGDYRVGVAIVNLRMAESLRKVTPTQDGLGDGSDTESNPST